jgi:hypothetical protein
MENSEGRRLRTIEDIQEYLSTKGKLNITERAEYIYVDYASKKTNFNASAPLDYFVGTFTKDQWIKDNLKYILTAETEEKQSPD